MKKNIELGLVKNVLLLILLFSLYASPGFCGEGFRKANPQMWGIFIGIGHYEYSENTLDYADNDAIAVQQALTRLNNFPPVNTRLLINQEATKQNIIKEFEELQAKVSSADKVVIYFSGHGLTKDQTEEGFGKGILPYDALPFSSDNDLTYSELMSLICHLTVYEVTFIMDACGSGEVLDYVSLKDTYEEENRQLAPKMTYLVSCSGDQVSKETNIYKHGIFTHFFLKALEDKKTDSNRDEQLSVREIYDSVTIQMSDARFKQTPEFGTTDNKNYRSNLTGFPGTPSLDQSFASNDKKGTISKSTPTETVKEYITKRDVWGDIYNQVYGTLSVSTVPPGCQILLNNRLIGTTPLSEKVREGEYLLQISRQGYNTINKSVKIRAGKKIKLTNLKMTKN